MILVSKQVVKSGYIHTRDSIILALVLVNLILVLIFYFESLFSVTCGSGPCSLVTGSVLGEVTRKSSGSGSHADKPTKRKNGTSEVRFATQPVSGSETRETIVLSDSPPVDVTPQRAAPPSTSTAASTTQHSTSASDHTHSTVKIVILVGGTLEVGYDGQGSAVMVRGRAIMVRVWPWWS